jgi:23S rRNA (guanosine2251-2'-O)-methyltransferase
MAGNSQRKGAMRKDGTKKGQVVGSGGQRRRGLEPKGPTPRATERTKHPAARKARSVEKKAEVEAKKAPAPRSGARGGTSIRASKDGVEMVFGRNSVLEALRSAVPGKALYVQQFLESDDRVREAFELAAELHLPMLEAQRSHLDKMTNGSVHQGLVLEVPPYEYAEAADLLDLAAAAGEPPLIVALDGITDPRNLGAVVRSAAAFGAHGVLVPERRAAGMTASAWKTSAGAAARVPVARATNLTRALKAYAEAGCFIIGLAAGETSLDDLDPGISTGPIVIVLGSEGEGLSRLVSETCDIVVGIPMTSTTESLNAGVAAGVTLYAVSHARRTG